MIITQFKPGIHGQRMSKDEINSENEMGLTPLYIAAIENDLARINNLIGKGAHVNIRNGKRRYLGKYEASALMRDHWGENIFQNNTALMVTRNIDILRVLIKSGADVNAQNVHGDSPLMMFVASQWDAGVEEIIKAGANPNLRNKKGYRAYVISEMMNKRIIKQSPFSLGIHASLKKYSDFSLMNRLLDCWVQIKYILFDKNFEYICG